MNSLAVEKGWITENTWNSVRDGEKRYRSSTAHRQALVSPNQRRIRRIRQVPSEDLAGPREWLNGQISILSLRYGGAAWRGRGGRGRINVGCVAVQPMQKNKSRRNMVKISNVVRRPSVPIMTATPFVVVPSGTWDGSWYARC